MNRCWFLGLLLVTASGVSVAADTATKTARVGFLRTEAPDELFAPFREGMRELGYVEGRNLVIEQRWAYGKYGDLPRLAQELVDLKVEVIFAWSTPCTQAALRATQTIPIVTVSGDPVGMGFAKSLARPGGTVTGMTLMLDELSTKRLELLKELAPGISSVTVLWAAENPFWERTGILNRMKQAGLALGMRVDAVKVTGSDQIEQVLGALRQHRHHGLYVFEDPLLRDHAAKIIAFAAKHRIPAIYGGANYVRNGGLMSYAPSFADLFKKAAGYVARILAGADPAGLPIHQPTEFELSVNLKTAKAMGFTIPESILVRATEVIR